MPKETPPLETRIDVMNQIIELLKPLDPDSQLRVMRTVAVFLDIKPREDD